MAAAGTQLGVTRGGGRKEGPRSPPVRSLFAISLHHHNQSQPPIRGTTDLTLLV